MTRASPSDIKDIAELPELSDSQIQTFIDDANAIINARVKGHVDKNLLQPAEEWLAAHLAVMNPKERSTRTESVGQSEMSFEGQYGLGLEHTRYGQQLLMMVPENLIKSAKGGHYTRTIHEEEEVDEPKDYEPDSWGGEF